MNTFTCSMAVMAGRGLGCIRAVLLDLSGTLHLEDTPTPAAITALRRLRETGLSLCFVTNTTKESGYSLLNRLQRIGFDVETNEIFTSLTAARQLVEREKLRPLLFLEDEAKKDFEGLEGEEGDADSVVVGLSPSLFNYDHLNRAFRLLLNGGRLIAIHKAKYFKQLDGMALGPGPFVTALEYASGRKATVVGKPEPEFFNSVLREIDCKAEETVMIGDDVLNDIHGAQQMGMKGILVKTGKYRHGDETSIDPPPSAVCEDFAHAVELIVSHTQK